MKCNACNADLESAATPHSISDCVALRAKLEAAERELEAKHANLVRVADTMRMYRTTLTEIANAHPGSGCDEVAFIQNVRAACRSALSATPDAPTSVSEGEEAVKRLGIDVPKWAAEIRDRIAKAVDAPVVAVERQHVITIVIGADGRAQADLDDERALWPDVENCSSIDAQAYNVLSQALLLLADAPTALAPKTERSPTNEPD